MMKFLLSILLILVVFMQCNRKIVNNPRRQPSSATNLAGEISTHLAKEYGLIPVGVGGEVKEGKIVEIKMRFFFNGEALNLSKGRRLIVKASQEVLRLINNKQEVQELFEKSPVKIENIDIAIFCHDIEGKEVYDPFMSIISPFGAKIKYYAKSPEDRYKYKELWESYAEALEIVKNEK